MTTWLSLLWERIRGSLWFLPGLMSLVAIGAAFLCGHLDEVVNRAETTPAFLYHGDAESARALLATVAGSMITVAGVSFSVTMVALSLASSQLGPRLLSNFMRDRGNQVVLGGLIATYLFCLLALGSSPDPAQEFASVSASVALLLAVSSLMLLIYFIHHIASSMQADYVIQAVARDVEAGLSKVFPTEEIDARPGTASEPEDTGGIPVVTERFGYLQGIDEDTLMAAARENDLCVRVLRRPGRYVGWGSHLARVVGRSELDGKVEHSIRRAFIIGGSRTAEQDPEYGIYQLVEIALRALSPGINDPFTAMTCIDHLSGILSSVAAVPERPPFRCDEDGHARVLLVPIDFPGVLDAAFDQIRQCSTGIASVSIRLLEGFEIIAGATRHPERLAAIERHTAMVFETNVDQLATDDRAALERRHADVLRATGNVRSHASQ